MGSFPFEKPHLVCVPFPAQGHITPMLKLAKLLHSHGFCITFVNTHYNHNRLLKAKAISPSSLDSLNDFQFVSMPDGLPHFDINNSVEDATQDIPSLCDSLTKNCLSPFLGLMDKINNSALPPVSCIIADCIMSFTLDAAKVLNVPVALFWTASACGFMGYFSYKHLVAKGLVPLKDESDASNGYLETPVECIPGFNNMRLRDFPSFIRTTNPEDIMLNMSISITERASMAKAIILNTFDELEKTVLDAMSSLYPPLYTIGPLYLLSQNNPNTTLSSLQSNLWAEEHGCIKWLQTKKPRSILYVNFGSITVMSNEQLIEFAWGLANSKIDFLWVIRPDMVRGDTAVVPQEFIDETKERGMLTSWCPQEAVLMNEAIGGFLTHSGWNSTLESIGNGVPMLSWPFFADQQTNCKFVCDEWGIGIEIGNNVERREVEGLIRELMEGKKGEEMRRKAVEWKESAASAIQPGGSSFLNFQKLIDEVLR